ncbi:MAG: DNA gyrase inhibitor YacG [Burkholderiaceae bacterium]|nr:DNA gyrase inhibitor YacG [Burkholderiaceae bacterium]
MTAVKCPTCGAQVEWTGASRFRPFCSERCKMIDLGTWASDGYSIAASDENNSEASDASSSDAPGRH